MVDFKKVVLTLSVLVLASPVFAANGPEQIPNAGMTNPNSIQNKMFGNNGFNSKDKIGQKPMVSPTSGFNTQRSGFNSSNDRNSFNRGTERQHLGQGFGNSGHLGNNSNMFNNRQQNNNFNSQRGKMLSMNNFQPRYR